MQVVRFNGIASTLAHAGVEVTVDATVAPPPPATLAPILRALVQTRSPSLPQYSFTRAGTDRQIEQAG